VQALRQQQNQILTAQRAQRGRDARGEGGGDDDDDDDDATGDVGGADGGLDRPLGVSGELSLRRVAPSCWAGSLDAALLPPLRQMSNQVSRMTESL